MIDANLLTDTVVFGTFNGLSVLGFGRLYGAHQNPEVFEIGHNSALQKSLSAPSDEIIFFKTLFPMNAEPVKVLGVIYHHRDNAGRLGFFGVGKLVTDDMPYGDILRSAFETAKWFGDDRAAAWEQINVQFESLSANASPKTVGFAQHSDLEDTLLCVSYIHGIWDGLLELSASVHSMDQRNIYFIGDTYSNVAISLNDFLRAVAAAVVSDREMLIQRHEAEIKNATIRSKKRIESSVGQLINGLQYLRTAQSDNLKCIDNLIQVINNEGLLIEASEPHNTVHQPPTRLDPPQTNDVETKSTGSRVNKSDPHNPRSEESACRNPKDLRHQHFQDQQRKAKTIRRFLIGGGAFLLFMSSGLIFIW